MSQSSAQDKKEQRLRLLDDEIGRHLDRTVLGEGLMKTLAWT